MLTFLHAWKGPFIRMRSMKMIKHSENGNSPYNESNSDNEYYNIAHDAHRSIHHQVSNLEHSIAPDIDTIDQIKLRSNTHLFSPLSQTKPINHSSREPLDILIPPQQFLLTHPLTMNTRSDTKELYELVYVHGMPMARCIFCGFWNYIHDPDCESQGDGGGGGTANSGSNETNETN